MDELWQSELWGRDHGPVSPVWNPEPSKGLVGHMQPPAAVSTAPGATQENQNLLCSLRPFSPVGLCGALGERGIPVSGGLEATLGSYVGGEGASSSRDKAVPWFHSGTLDSCLEERPSPLAGALPTPTASSAWPPAVMLLLRQRDFLKEQPQHHR